MLQEALHLQGLRRHPGFGELAEPMAYDASTACCNPSGHTGDSQYPLCKA